MFRKTTATSGTDSPRTNTKPTSARDKEENKKTFGRLTFRLDYNFDQKILYVTIVSAQDLPAMDLSGTSDPFVKLYLQPEKKKKFETKKHKKTLNPVFNETFAFKNLPFTDIPGKTLVLSVFDYDQFGSNDQIGEIIIPLGSIDLGRVIEETRDVKEPPKDVLGDLCFSLRYAPQKSQLTVVIMEARNLKKMDIGGASDPYVKLGILQNGKRIKKSKTTIKMNTLNPYYNESFRFEISPEMMNRIQLSLVVMDYDRVGSNDPIGRLILGSNVGGALQRHWNDMLAAPRRSIAQWHTLQPFDD